ncbi:hypothetical protein Bbelb_253580 [Branchiostoma belcheri]|nr:hypothetical protein Bbelb_253580 [Branchiostoma belcheri]
MTSRTKRLAVTKRQDSAGDMDDRQGGDTDSAPSKNNIRIMDRKVEKGENCIVTVDKILRVKFDMLQVKIVRAHPDDDLTATDLQEKRKWRENGKQAFERGLKYRFYNGYCKDGKGKAVSFSKGYDDIVLQPADDRSREKSCRHLVTPAHVREDVLLVSADRAEETVPSDVTEMLLYTVGLLAS